MAVLTDVQKTAFHANGWLLLADAVTPAQLAALRADMHAWTQESRGHARNYGRTINARPRFDLDPTHGPDHPALRRVNAPIEVSQAHFEVATDSRMVDAVTDLIGPDVKLHHTKTNSKQPHTVTPVKYHQDFAFTPHSNEDVVTALLLLDDVDAHNGALEVVSGSHRGPIHSLWRDGRFLGFIDEALERAARADAALVTGPAGAVCLMHTRLLHGSAPNDSAHARTLFISVYSAEDAVPLSPNPMPHRHEGLLVRGRRSGRVRATAFALELPELLTGASFFEQQQAAGG
jgi:ectoine hydroxylase-related dioxygenase (phytanoyl-CoA dioxygenase family)